MMKLEITAIFALSRILPQTEANQHMFGRLEAPQILKRSGFRSFFKVKAVCLGEKPIFGLQPKNRKIG
ncbi:hypothetical protein RSK20926_15491 [Roseobacter sp. SK209-2-6]|nr:hypothetical protein RSK20926_15491 [Roseobacter sp. SK209-2-6]